MKKLMMMVVATAMFGACCNGDAGVVINEQDHENIAYNKSYELSERVVNAKSYEEYKVAADELRAYEEAFRTQIGGDSYLIFLEESNAILNNI
ncbi:MAG: hypothetical protein IJ464_07155 [Alistipes sp.]|nr:hypothetical protein [Alistipes sp.]